ncbi:hypothetical protein N0V90_001587 [Kalmusia sp. IMI 367209]|nr:hypothetical protein N0V90_001587 [Kalmusia sp. IMI 367209]
MSDVPEIVFFTDFDGTITTIDSNDHLVYQMHSLNHSLEDCIEFQRKTIHLDAGFRTFYDWAKASNVPVVILSGGLRPLILALLGKVLREAEIPEVELFSNEVEHSHDNITADFRRNWSVRLHDESEFGIDKGVIIQQYVKKWSSLSENDRPTILFAGDGVSDLSAARAYDLLFAKGGKGL